MKLGIYHELAEIFLELRDYPSFLTSSSGDFGFIWMREYTGLMAQPGKRGKLREKQGLFDIVIHTGSRYAKVTHKQLMDDIITHCTLDECLEVWRGGDPRIFSGNSHKQEVLTTMALLMFEQELNWGKQIWQKSTNFSPKMSEPKQTRPRDMLMGFILQAYALGVDNIKYSVRSKPGTFWFFDALESQYGFQTYPDTHKRFFVDDLRALNGTEALMCGKMLQKFKDKALEFSNNPKYGS